MRLGKHKFIFQSPIQVKFQWPIMYYTVFGAAITPFGWKRRMKKAAREGKMLQAVKEIKFGTGLGLKDSKELWDNKYKKKYYRPR